MFFRSSKKELPVNTESGDGSDTGTKDDETSSPEETSPESPPSAYTNSDDGTEPADEHCHRRAPMRGPLKSQIREAKSEQRKIERLEPWRKMVMIDPEIIKPKEGNCLQRQPDSMYRQCPIKKPSMFDTKKKVSSFQLPEDGSFPQRPASPDLPRVMEWEARYEEHQLRQLEPWRKMVMVDHEVPMPTDGSCVARPPSPSYRYEQGPDVYEKVVDKGLRVKMRFPPEETPEPGACVRQAVHPEVRFKSWEPNEVNEKIVGYLEELDI